MNLYDRIGTMVFTPTDRYIIGASDSANEDFRKKGENIIEFHQRDTVEFSCIRQMDLKSENYENYMKTKKMPKGCFGDSFGYKMQESIADSVLAYCLGEMTEEQIQKALIDACKDMRVYQVQMGHTSGVNAKDNGQIVGDVYEIFQKYNVRFMAMECFEAGSDIAEANGGKDQHNWVYYDSKYYEESQHLRGLLQEASNELAAGWNADFIDFEKIEKESRFTLDGKMDFNSVWDYQAHQRNICTMSGEWQPQEHFTFFYQANKNKDFSGEYTLDSQAGICIVGFGGREWTLEVPFNNSVVLGKTADHFNAKDLFVEKSLYREPNLLRYLESFEVYTRFHGHNKTMKGEW